MDINYDQGHVDYSNYHRDKEYLENETLFKNIFKKRQNIISRFINNPRIILDIGCSNGIFLDLYKNCETWGVEPSSNYKVAELKMHKILNTTFEKARLPENYFDLIIMNHTLEHVKDGEIVLAKIFRLLKKGGILFIDVPNAGGLSSKLFGHKWPYRLPNEHTYQFTKESLSKLVNDTGFEVLHWESRSGLFELANPLLDLFQSLMTFKKRFVTNIILSPYHLIVTLLNIGDSMSLVAQKN